MSRLLTIGVLQQARNLANGGGTPGTTPTAEEYFTIIDVTGGCRITDYDTDGGLAVIIPDTIDGKTVLEIYGGGSLSYQNGAFRDKGLTSAVLPSGLKTITSRTMKGAFRGNALETIEFPASLEYVGSSAFRDNAGIASIVIPVSSALTTIGDYAFSSASTPALSSLDFSNAASLVSIETSAFISCAIDYAVLPANVTIGDHASTLGNLGLKAYYEGNDSLAGTYEYNTDTSSWDFTPEA